MEMEAKQTPHTFIFVDKGGFNLAKTHCRWKNVIGQRATVDVPGQRGANITMCAALSNDGVLLYKPLIGLYNTERLISFLDDLHNQLMPAKEWGQRGRNTFVIVWDNVVFHHSALVTDWFAAHPRMSVLFFATILLFPKPHWRVFLCGEVEGVRLLSIWPAVPARGHECRVYRYFSWSLPG